MRLRIRLLALCGCLLLLAGCFGGVVEWEEGGEPPSRNDPAPEPPSIPRRDPVRELPSQGEETLLVLDFDANLSELDFGEGGSLRVRGATGGEVLYLDGLFTLPGDLTLENLVFESTGTGSARDVFAGGHHFTLGEGVTCVNIGNIYGGGMNRDGEDENARSHITIMSGKVEGYIYSTPQFSGLTAGDALVEIRGGSVGGVIAGDTFQQVLGSTTILVEGGSVGSIVGGARRGFYSTENGRQSGDCHISIRGGQVLGSVYGGGFDDTRVGNVSIELSGGVVHGNVYGGGWHGDADSTRIVITGGSVYGSVFGAGDNANISGNVEVEVAGGEVRGVLCAGDVYDYQVQVQGERRLLLQGSRYQPVPGELYLQDGSRPGGEWYAPQNRLLQFLRLAPTDNHRMVCDFLLCLLETGPALSPEARELLEQRSYPQEDNLGIIYQSFYSNSVWSGVRARALEVQDYGGSGTRFRILLDIQESDTPQIPVGQGWWVLDVGHFSIGADGLYPQWLQPQEWYARREVLPGGDGNLGRLQTLRWFVSEDPFASTDRLPQDFRLILFLYASTLPDTVDYGITQQEADAAAKRFLGLESVQARESGDYDPDTDSYYCGTWGGMAFTENFVGFYRDSQGLDHYLHEEYGDSLRTVPTRVVDYILQGETILRAEDVTEQAVRDWEALFQ